MAHMSLGIDFGTTTTLVAIRQEGYLPEVLKIGEQDRSYMPSVVAFVPGVGGEFEVLVGEEAVRAREAADVITSIKRCLGCDGSRCRTIGGRLDQSRSRGRFRASNFGRCQQGQIFAGGRSWRPEDIASFIIREALQRSRRILLERDDLSALADITICPTNFGCSATADLPQRDLLVNTATKLGFKHVRPSNIVEEPIAAGVGFAHLEGLKPGRTLVYDFGGGTFDAAVVDVDRDVRKVTILASGGVAFLGGDDIDHMLVNHFLKWLSEEHGLTVEDMEDLLTPGLDERELRNQAESAKIELSEHMSAEVTLNLSLDVFHLSVTRSQLEMLLAEVKNFERQSLMQRSLDCVREVLIKARVYAYTREGNLVDKEGLRSLKLEQMVEDVDYVLPVGGVTRIPYVRDKLGELFGDSRIYEGYILEDPVNAVAQGAALDKEYENLILAAPPYSIVAEYTDGDGQPKLTSLYQAYTPLWPNPNSPSRGDLSYIGDTISPAEGPVKVSLVSYDGKKPQVIFKASRIWRLRISIDHMARITVEIDRGLPKGMAPETRVIAPWRHDVQILLDVASPSTGHDFDFTSVYREN